jgi:hypothetical protein
MRSRLFLIFSLILLALFAGACGQSRAETETTEADTIAQTSDIAEEDTDEALFETQEPVATAEPTAEPAPVATDGPVKDIYAIGDTARLEAFRVQINDATFAAETELGKAEEGKQFLLIDVSLENTTDEAQDVAALLQMTLKDQSGTEYPLDITASLEAATKLNGSIQPGTTSGVIGYQVPLEATGFQWIFRTISSDTSAGIAEKGHITFDVAE